MMVSSPKLHLSPSHSLHDTRSLPLNNMGRKSLATWWWMSCPCGGAVTRKPCFKCKRLGKNVGYLSKIMYHIDVNGYLRIDKGNKSRHLMWINGKRQQELMKGNNSSSPLLQLQEGDTLHFGRCSSIAWMTFHVSSKGVVTPEKEVRTKSRQRKEIDSSHECRYSPDDSIRNLQNDLQKEKNKEKNNQAWLKTLARKGRSNLKRLKNVETSKSVIESNDSSSLQHRESSSCDEGESEASARYPSQQNIRQDLKRKVLVTQPSPAEKKNEDVVQENNEESSEWSIYRKNRKRSWVSIGNRYRQEKPWQEQESSSISSGVCSTIEIIALQTQHEQKSISTQQEMKKAITEKKSSSSSRSVKRTQEQKPKKRRLVLREKKQRQEHSKADDISERIKANPLLRTLTGQSTKKDTAVEKESLLLLPECPTYDGDSIATKSTTLKYTQKSNVSKVTGLNNNNYQFVPEKKELVKNLDSDDWQQMPKGNSLVRQALSDIVTIQRSKHKDDQWLPTMLQNTVLASSDVCSNRS